MKDVASKKSQGPPVRAQHSAPKAAGPNEATKSKQAVRQKHVPQRTCVACRQTAGKRALIRLVRVGDSVEVDPTGKRAGRGMYLHATRDCWTNALQGGRIGQALKMRLTPEDRDALLHYMESLPVSVDEPAEGAASPVGNEAQGPRAA